jgi:hypothetical protein
MVDCTGCGGCQELLGQLRAHSHQWDVLANSPYEWYHSGQSGDPELSHLFNQDHSGRGLFVRHCSGLIHGKIHRAVLLGRQYRSRLSGHRSGAGRGTLCDYNLAPLLDLTLPAVKSWRTRICNEISSMCIFWLRCWPRSRTRAEPNI